MKVYFFPNFISPASLILRFYADRARHFKLPFDSMEQERCVPRETRLGKELLHIL